MSAQPWASNGRIVQRWDDAQDAELTRLLGQGLTQRQIAAAMGRSLKAVNNRVPRLTGGSRADAWLPEHDAQLLALAARGLPNAAIGARMDPPRTKRSVKDRKLILQRKAVAVPEPPPAPLPPAVAEDPDDGPAAVPVCAVRRRVLVGTPESRAKAEERLDLFRLWERRNAALSAQ